MQTAAPERIICRTVAATFCGPSYPESLLTSSGDVERVVTTRAASASAMALASRIPLSGWPRTADTQKLLNQLLSPGQAVRAAWTA